MGSSVGGLRSFSHLHNLDHHLRRVCPWVRPVIGMVWYGLVWGVKPNHTRCLHNNQYGITGKTNNTSKDAKTFKNHVENL
jgi:hypothetical protein